MVLSISLPNVERRGSLGSFSSVSTPADERLNRYGGALRDAGLHEPAYGLFGAVYPGDCLKGGEGLEVVVVGQASHVLQLAKCSTKMPSLR